MQFSVDVGSELELKLYQTGVGAHSFPLQPSAVNGEAAGLRLGKFVAAPGVKSC
jgi:hypothetical protein